MYLDVPCMYITTHSTTTASDVRLAQAMRWLLESTLWARSAAMTSGYCFLTPVSA